MTEIRDHNFVLEDKNTKKTENMIEATRIYVTSFKETDEASKLFTRRR